METGAILFHCKQMGPLARRICAIDPRIKLGNISWKRFEDGFPNIYIEKHRQIRRANVAFLAAFEEMGDIFEQLSAVMALTRSGAQLLRIILPYFPTGTMERVDDEGQVATAKTLSRFISSTPICGQGPAEIVLYDVHTLQQRFYFGDNIVPRLKSATKYLKRELAKTPDDLAIVFPDFGAKKRFGKMFADYEQIVCEKIRNGKDRVVTIAEGDPRGKHNVIVDDIINSGATLIKCKDTLNAAGAGSVSVFATHASCPRDSWKNFVDAGFANVWISDSCPRTAEKVRGTEPFRILSLDESIAHVIVDEDEPLPREETPPTA